MRYTVAKQGRIFILRLEDGDIVHEEIEKFVSDHLIRAAALIILGGCDRGSRLVVGPKKDRTRPIEPLEMVLHHAHEVMGVGTLFPDDKGNPMLHMHMGCGREDSTVTGCIRKGVKVWHVMEAILFELCDNTAIRTLDQETGFYLLQPE